MWTLRSRQARTVRRLADFYIKAAALGSSMSTHVDPRTAEGSERPILIVDDDDEVRETIRAHLERCGFVVREATGGEDAVQRVFEHMPALVVMDVTLRDTSGLQVCRRLRATEATRALPIIMLTARKSEVDRVVGLELGADDYVTKPFGVNELLARMRAALRHASRTAADIGEPVFTLGDLKVDLGRRLVFVSGKETHLTPIEYKLLTTLIRNAGKVLTHRQLLKEVWGPLHVEEGHYLRVYMRQLRNKVENNPAHPRYLVTELGVGYRLRTE